MGSIVLHNCDTASEWNTSDASNFALADEGTIKKEGANSLKITSLFGKTQNITHAIAVTGSLIKGTTLENTYFQAPNPGTLHKMDVYTQDAGKIKAKAFYESGNNWIFRNETNLINVSSGENLNKTFGTTLKVYKDDYIGYYCTDYIYAAGTSEAQNRSGDIASNTTKASWANGRFGMIGFYLSGSLDESAYVDLGSGNEKDIRTMNIIGFWMRASRAGTILRFGFGMSAWSDNVFDIIINEADTWEKQIIDLSDISQDELNQVRYLGFRCINADEDTTIYVDDIRAQDNLLFNSEAELGDTTGWTATNVIAEGASSNTGVNLELEIGEGGDDAQLWGGWMMDDRPQLVLLGWDGTYYFLFGETGTLVQVLASDNIGDLPVTFESDIKFKLVTAQNLWDAKVKSRVTLNVLYTDNTNDIFIMPLVRGIDYEGHELLNSWINLIAEFALRANLGVKSITVTGATDSLTDGLKVDWIKIKKHMELADDSLAKNAFILSPSAFDLDGPNPPDKTNDTAAANTGFNEYLSFAQGEYSDAKMDFPIPRNYNGKDVTVRYEYSIDEANKRHTMQLRVTNVGPNSDHNPSLGSAFDIGDEQVSSSTSGKRQIATAKIPQSSIGWIAQNTSKIRLQGKTDANADTDEVRLYWLEFRWKVG